MMSKIKPDQANYQWPVLRCRLDCWIIGYMDFWGIPLIHQGNDELLHAFPPIVSGLGRLPAAGSKNPLIH